MTRVRFAPSPTGKIHLGNARPALMNWLYALQTGGEYVLRFDDTDTVRSTKEYADAILVDLDWLGIKPTTMARQSERIALYNQARDRLIESGRLYACYETPDELDRKRARARAMGKPPIYDRAALNLSEDDKKKLEAEGRKPHWRFKLDGRQIVFDDLIRGKQTVQTGSLSDPVLLREDGSYLYTLPSVVDDIDLGITHVIRGEDHVSNTGVQIELFEALGATPPIFAHHNLLTDEQGKGLSKRLGSLALSDMRANGYEPIAVAIMASLTGTSAPIQPYHELKDLADALDFSSISHGPARYSPAELDALNARIVHSLAFDEVKDRLAEYGVTEAAVWHALRENLTKLSDIKDWTPIITGPITAEIANEDKEFLEKAAQLLPEEPWDEETWGHWTKAIKQETGRKGKQLFMPLRLALTGMDHGPELKALLPLLGRKVCLDRLS